MLRTLRAHCPAVRNTAGSSLGPITISATTPISRNSVQEISNMEIPGPFSRHAGIGAGCPRSPAAGASGHLGAGLGTRFHHVAGLMVEGLNGRIGVRRVGLFLRHALLEGFDAFGDIAHHVRNLAAPAEYQEQHGADDQPMPDTQGAHQNLRARLAPALAAPFRFQPKLGVGGVKNKRNTASRRRASRRVAERVYSSIRSGGGVSPRSRSSGSSGSSSSRSAGSSDGIGMVNPAGGDFSTSPAPLSSSIPGRSASASRPKWDMKASVVP